jgi:hypothetical protein
VLPVELDLVTPVAMQLPIGEMRIVAVAASLAVTFCKMNKQFDNVNSFAQNGFAFLWRHLNSYAPASPKFMQIKTQFQI